MKVHIHRRFNYITLLALVLIAGCINSEYSGDGHLISKGHIAAHDKYILELGTVDRGHYSYRLLGLPTETFTLGLNISTSLTSHNLCLEKPVSNFVTMVLSTEKGEIVVSESAPLNEWTWSGSLQCEHESFVYQKGRYEKVDLGNDTFTDQHLELKPHNGWGSYFSASNSMEYTLDVTIQEQFPTGFTAKLKAKGGGWK